MTDSDGNRYFTEREALQPRQLVTIFSSTLTSSYTTIGYETSRFNKAQVYDVLSKTGQMGYTLQGSPDNANWTVLASANSLIQASNHCSVFLISNVGPTLMPYTRFGVVTQTSGVDATIYADFIR